MSRRCLENRVTHIFVKNKTPVPPLKIIFFIIIINRLCLISYLLFLSEIFCLNEVYLSFNPGDKSALREIENINECSISLILLS